MFNKKLNKNQKEAILNDRKASLVVADVGSGKTTLLHILTKRLMK